MSFVSLTGGTFLVAFDIKRKKKPVPPTLPPISIIKPLKGTDDGLTKNLISFFELEYPKFELLFSVADPNDEVRVVVEELIKTFPKVDAHLIVGGSHVGENPKVNNIFVSYKTAKYDLILISDSNIRVKKNYLKQLIAEMKDGVSLVTACIAGHHANSLGGRLEANYLNTFLNRWMHLSYLVNHPIVMGKSMLLRRSEFDEMGGLKAVSNYIAEDYATGRLMQSFDRKIVLLRDPVTQYLGNFTFAAFWARHVRWGRIRKSCSLFEFLIEPLSCALVASLMGAYSFHKLFHTPLVPFFSLYLTYWALQDIYLIKTRGEKIGPGSFAVWFLFECLTLPIWFHTLLGSSIEWRGNRLRLGAAGKLVPTIHPLDSEFREPFPTQENIFTSETQEISRKLVNRKNG